MPKRAAPMGPPITPGCSTKSAILTARALAPLEADSSAVIEAQRNVARWRTAGDASPQAYATGNSLTCVV